MKKYVKASGDLWYTAPSGKDVHAYLDFNRVETIRDVLEPVMGIEGSDRFIDLFEGWVDG